MPLSLYKAWERLTSVEITTRPEKVSIENANGRICCSTIYAASDSPPFNQSRFDGFALGEIAGERYQIVGDMVITAGVSPSVKLSPGQAIRIMTGAPLPDGTTHVVPSESCRIDNQGFLYVQDLPSPEMSILRKGANFLKGHPYLKRGEKINPFHISFLALDGKEDVTVFSLPLITILSLGDELEEIGKEVLEHGKIRNSHPFLLSAILRSCGIVADTFQVEDEPKKVHKRLADILSSPTQLLITTGGMGKGVKDITRKTLRKAGALPLFEGVQAFPIGTFSCYLWHNKVIFALPGGQVGVALIAKLFIQPFLLKMQGAKRVEFFSPLYQARFKKEKGDFTQESGKSKTIKFFKAKTWFEGGNFHVKRLSSRSLTEMNSFIVSGVKENKKNSVNVFPLWDGK